MSPAHRTFALVLPLAAALALAALPARAQGARTAAPSKEGTAIDVVTLPSPGSPLVAVRLLFDVGSIHDPAGKEGLAGLTSLMVGEAGTRQRTYSQLIDALYPMASTITVNVDREVTLLSGEVHRDQLEAYGGLLAEAVLQPAFAEEDFRRNKEKLLALLTTTLRATNDELLGLELLQDVIWKGHPYGHPPAGTVEGLSRITLDDVKAFYREHYTQANLMLGVAGGYPEGFPERFAGKLAALPAGTKGRTALPPAPKPEGRSYTLVAKQTASVGLHFGFPLPVTRADADYYPLMVANSYLGEHRTSHGRLFKQLRELRGLNYGDYSYVEYWDLPPYTNNPTPNVPRRQQYFSVWIRPVVPETAHFALRDALSEVDRLVGQGMTKEEFELTRDFLVNYSKLWAQTLSDRLGFLMDSRFYGMPYYIDEVEKRLAALTVDDVNRAVKKHLGTRAYHAVVVTGDAAGFKAALQKDEPSPMKYGSDVGADVLAADETIQKRKVEPTAVEIVPVDQVFQK